MIGPDKKDGELEATLRPPNASWVWRQGDLLGHAEEASPAGLAWGYLPSNHNIDNTPVTVLEAMAAGFAWSRGFWWLPLSAERWW